MKRKRNSDSLAREMALFEEIIDFIFDRSSKIVLGDYRRERIGLFSRLSTILDPYSLQQLVAEIETYFRIKVENSEIFKGSTVNGLPGFCPDGDCLGTSPYRVKTFFSLTRLIVNKI